MEKDPRDVIIRPVITEHSYDAMENNVYTFEVAKDANKVEIRQAIEAIFNVKVVKVNTLNVKSKPKRVRYQEGRTRTWKRARPSRSSLPSFKRSSRQGPKARETKAGSRKGAGLFAASRSPRRVFALSLGRLRHFSVSGYGRIED